MPVRSPRYVYELNITITENVDDDKAAIDAAPTQTVSGTQKQIYVKMKRSIGDWLGLTPLAYNNSIWTGTFKAGQTGATNTGSKFRRRVGGFRVASYTLIARGTFTIPELVRQADGSYLTVNTKFKSVSIGFPRGHSVTEFIDWLGTTTKMGEVEAIRTPAGNTVPIYVASGTAPAPIT